MHTCLHTAVLRIIWWTLICNSLLSRSKSMGMAETAAKASRSHFSPYLRGIIVGLFIAGWTYAEIAEGVENLMVHILASN